jgi:hypothetical protein
MVSVDPRPSCASSSTRRAAGGSAPRPTTSGHTTLCSASARHSCRPATTAKRRYAKLGRTSWPSLGSWSFLCRCDLDQPLPSDRGRHAPISRSHTDPQRGRHAGLALPGALVGVRRRNPECVDRSGTGSTSALYMHSPSDRDARPRTPPSCSSWRTCTGAMRRLDTPRRSRDGASPGPAAQLSQRRSRRAPEPSTRGALPRANSPARRR